MVMSKRRKDLFIKDLQVLLDKYRASINAEGEGGDFPGTISVFVEHEDGGREYFSMGHYVGPTREGS